MDTNKFLRGLFEAMNPTKAVLPPSNTRAVINTFSPAHLQYVINGRRLDGHWDATILCPSFLTAGGILKVTETMCEILKKQCGSEIHVIKLLEEDREDFEIVLDEKVFAA